MIAYEFELGEPLAEERGLFGADFLCTEYIEV